MKTKVKRHPFSRVVCVLLTVLTVFGAMSSLFFTEPQKVKAASDWYTIVTASSDRYGSEVHYYGYDYENKKMVTSGEGLSFAFTSGYESSMATNSITRPVRRWAINSPPMR